MSEVSPLRSPRTVADLDEKTRQAVTQFAAAVRASGKFDVAGIALYGSRARGDHHEESDADVAVIVNGVKGRTLPIMWELVDYTMQALLNIGVDISPFAVRSQDWSAPDDYANPAFLRNVQRDGVWL